MLHGRHETELILYDRQIDLNSLIRLFTLLDNFVEGHGDKVNSKERNLAQKLLVGHG